MLIQLRPKAAKFLANLVKKIYLRGSQRTILRDPLQLHLLVSGFKILAAPIGRIRRPVGAAGNRLVHAAALHPLPRICTNDPVITNWCVIVFIDINLHPHCCRLKDLLTN